MDRKRFIKSTLTLGLMAFTNPLKALSDRLNEQEEIMPAFFIGHGSPTNALEDNEFTQSWRSLGKQLPIPKAVLCISAHWLTRGTHVTAMESPKTIHDFGGFGPDLFAAQYPAPGSPKFAKETQEIITSTEIGLDHDWGLDHGTWSILKQMYPEANIPVYQLSIDYHQSPQYHYNLSKELVKLRNKGVLIIGSGNMVHNLRLVDPSKGFAPDKEGKIPEYGFDWAEEFNTILKTNIQARDYQAAVDYSNLGSIAKLAHPTPDHYYPLLYSLGVALPDEPISFFNDKCMAGSLSMTSIQFGGKA